MYPHAVFFRFMFLKIHWADGIRTFLTKEEKSERINKRSIPFFISCQSSFRLFSAPFA